MKKQLWLFGWVGAFACGIGSGAILCRVDEWWSLLAFFGLFLASGLFSVITVTAGWSEGYDDGHKAGVAHQKAKQEECIRQTMELPEPGDLMR